MDQGAKTISRVSFEGRHRKTVVESNGYLDQLFGLAVFEVRQPHDTVGAYQKHPSLENRKRRVHYKVWISPILELGQEV